MAFVTSAPDETLRQLQARLPLTGAGRPVGIITLEDIVEQVRAVRADPRRHCCCAGRALRAPTA